MTLAMTRSQIPEDVLEERMAFVLYSQFFQKKNAMAGGHGGRIRVQKIRFQTMTQSSILILIGRKNGKDFLSSLSFKMNLPPKVLQRSGIS